MCDSSQQAYIAIISAVISGMFTSLGAVLIVRCSKRHKEEQNHGCSCTSGLFSCDCFSKELTETSTELEAVRVEDVQERERIIVQLREENAQHSESLRTKSAHLQQMSSSLRLQTEKMERLLRERRELLERLQSQSPRRQNGSK